MCKCIYSLTNERESSFSSKEHLIPESLGGHKTLPKGFVCDEVNTVFSRREKEFLHTPNIDRLKEFYGPLTKRGKKRIKNKNDKPRMEIFETSEGLFLGYTRESKPKLINQIFIDDGIKHICTSLATDAESNLEEAYMDLFHSLKNLDIQTTRFNEVKNCKLKKTEYIIGFHGNYHYVAFNPVYNIEDIKPVLQRFITAAIQQVDEKYISSMCRSAKFCEEQPIIHNQSSFCINNKKIVIAKIAVNCLASKMGHSFILGCQFDPIRSAIHEGEDMGVYVEQFIHESAIKFIKDSLVGINVPIQEIGKRHHCILLFPVDGKQKCAVCFYGFAEIHIVTLAETIPIPVYAALICDWENKNGHEKEKWWDGFPAFPQTLINKEPASH